MKTPVLECAYYGDVIGTFQITESGSIIWSGKDHPYRGLFDGESSTSPPRSLKTLAPEGWLNDVLKSPDPLKYIGDGIRFLSNVTISPDTKCLYEKIEGDRIHALLDDNTDNSGVFQGAYDESFPPISEADFQTKLGSYWQNPLMPKFSGAQIKLPVSIYPDGFGSSVVYPAHNQSFSHILKYPGIGFHQPIASLEWMGLEMAERAGLNAAKHALLAFGSPPGLLIERFDIPNADDPEDTRYLIADFCTTMGVDPVTKKYGTPAEHLAKNIKEISSEPDKDTVAMFKRHVFAWFACDCDMHMKNMSVLKTFSLEDRSTQIRMAPVYDTLPTVALPSKGDMHLALPIGGKTSNLRMTNFMNLARTLGLDEESAQDMVREIAEKTAKAAVDIATAPPAPIANHQACHFAIKHAATEIVDRVRAFGFDVPEWTPVRPDKEMRKAMRTFATEMGMNLTMA